MKKIWMKLKSYYHRLFFPSLNKKSVKKNLALINEKIMFTQPQDIPKLFQNVSLDIFGRLLLEMPPTYTNIKAFFPSMASNEDQDLWTGTHGLGLLIQSLVFVKDMISGYEAITNSDIRNAKVLDFGCGWGRLIRLLYKFVPYEQIYGIDPWEKSIEVCRAHGIKANLAVSDWVPRTVPFDIQFDLIFAFSVFTHLSEKTCAEALSTLRNHISTDGLLVITVRPKDYWFVHKKGAFASQMCSLHDEKGFAFIPQGNMALLDGDITYGDTSISINYLEKNFPQWKIVKTITNVEDPYQTLIFLHPV